MFAWGLRRVDGANYSPMGICCQSPKGNNYHHDARKRLSYNEKREFEQLGKDLVLLEEEKKEIEEKFSNGMLSIDEITKLSKRLPEVKSAIDEKETRWLELSEYEA